MNIEQEDDGKRGRFYIEQDGALMAEIIYTWSGHEMTIHHTNVDEEWEGRGIGSKLVEKAINYARHKGATVFSLCPFSSSVIDRTPAFQDIAKHE